MIKMKQIRKIIHTLTLNITKIIFAPKKSQMFVLVLILGGLDGRGYTDFHEKKISVSFSMYSISFTRDKGCYDNLKSLNIPLNDA